MRRKKIIHLIQSLDSGGCENMLLRTLPLLTDFEHTVITLKNRGELADNFEEKNIKIVNIGQKNVCDIASHFKLVKTIKLLESDLIITYLFHADMIGRIILQLFCKKPVIPFLRTTYNHKKYLTAKIFEKTTKYFVKKYLANSESVKNFYIKNLRVLPGKITVIPNGIDVEFYEKIKRDEKLKENLGLEKDAPAIICVANLHINKGHKYLLEAFEGIFCHLSGSGNLIPYLLLVGDGEEKENLEKQIKNYKSKNKILFLGKRNDVPELLKISDIFVLPTIFEGMSNAILEAMASGLPIITTDIPENKVLVENNKNGILVPVKRSGPIQKAIKEILKNPFFGKNLSNNSRIFIEKKFALKNIAGQWNFFLNNNA